MGGLLLINKNNMEKNKKNKIGKVGEIINTFGEETAVLHVLKIPVTVIDDFGDERIEYRREEVYIPKIDQEIANLQKQIDELLAKKEATK